MASVGHVSSSPILWVGVALCHPSLNTFFHPLTWNIHYLNLSVWKGGDCWGGAQLGVKLWITRYPVLSAC